MQTPQGLDAKHRDELFPVQREYIDKNSGVRRASIGGLKILGLRFFAPSLRRQKTGNEQQCRRRKGLMRNTAMSCFSSNASTLK
jgi:hypothetical protein